MAVGICPTHAPVAIISREIAFAERDGFRISVETGYVPAIGCGPNASNTACGHRVQIGRCVGKAVLCCTQGCDGDVPIPFLSRVIEDRFLDAVLGKPRNRHRYSPFLDVHSDPSGRVPKNHANGYTGVSRTVCNVSDDSLPWEDALATAGGLESAVVERILAIHGDRGRRAIDAVMEGRVKRYRDFLVVVGRNEEYVVEGRACTCFDALYNLDPDDETAWCWHALAARIAVILEEVDTHDMWYSDVREFL